MLTPSISTWWLVLERINTARCVGTVQVASAVLPAETAELGTVRSRWLSERETLQDSPIKLFAQNRAAGWSCLLGVRGEAAERVRLGVGLVRVGAGRCCSHNKGGENDSSADKHFRDHFQGSFHLFVTSYDVWLLA